MLKVVFILLVAVGIAHGQAFSVKWCPGSEAAKKSLENALNQSRYPDDPAVLNLIFERWAKEQRLPNAFAVVQRGNRFLKWPRPGTNSVAPFDKQLSVLGTRSVSRPTNSEIACFFQDTLVLVDTLRFFTGRSSKIQIFLKINDKEYKLPRDETTGELILSSTALPGVPLSAYQSATMWVYVNQKRQEQAQGVLYIFRPSEKQAFLEALPGRLFKKSDCEELLNEALLLLNGFWGRKQCKDSDPYDYAQRGALRQLMNCQE